MEYKNKPQHPAGYPGAEDLEYYCLGNCNGQKYGEAGDQGNCVETGGIGDEEGQHEEAHRPHQIACYQDFKSSEAV